MKQNTEDIEKFIENLADVKKDPKAENLKIKQNMGSNLEIRKGLQDALIEFFTNQVGKPINATHTWITRPVVCKFLGDKTFWLVNKLISNATQFDEEYQKESNLLIKRIIRGNKDVHNQTGENQEGLIHLCAKYDNDYLFKYFVTSYKQAMTSERRSAASVIRGTIDKDGKTPVNYIVENKSEKCLRIVMDNAISALDNQVPELCSIEYMVTNIHVPMFKNAIVELAKAKASSAHKIAKETRRIRSIQ